MTKPRDPEALLAAYLVEGMEVLPDRVADAVLDEIHRTRQRGVLGPWRTRSMFKPSLAVAAVVAVLVAGALLTTRRDQPVIGNPSPSASASAGASGPAVVGPSATPTATPSPTPTPLLWTEASLKEDWPAPVRSEPVEWRDRAAGPRRAWVLSSSRIPRTTAGPSGSCGSTSGSCTPAVPSKVVIELADNHPPLVDPTEQWIAYGVVVDADRDGVPDWRYGVDNLPIDPSGWAGNPDSERMARSELANGVAPHRAWRTNLHTGRTESAAGPPYGGVGETYFDTFYPPGGYGPDGARLGFGGDVAGGGTRTSLAGPYYTWAAVIENGRVVATDYAPDVGWLDPWAEAKP